MDVKLQLLKTERYLRDINLELSDKEITAFLRQPLYFLLSISTESFFILRLKNKLL